MTEDYTFALLHDGLTVGPSEFMVVFVEVELDYLEKPRSTLRILCLLCNPSTSKYKHLRWFITSEKRFLVS